MDKILDLISLLKTRKTGVSRAWLQKRWNCSQPTVHRVVARTRERNVPLIYSVSRGAYFLEQGKEIEAPGLWFNADELAALLGLSHWLGSLGTEFLKEKLEPITTRLEEILKDQGLDVIEWKNRIRLLPIHFRPVDPENLLSAAQAVLRRKRACFTYQGIRDSSPRKRNISPQTLVRYRDNWYLDALDHGSNKLRSFAMSRLRNFEVLHEIAEDVPRVKLDNHFGEAYGIFSGLGKKQAILEFDGLAAKLASEEGWHPNQRKSHLPGGKLRLSFPCGDIRELARDVMRYADEVTIKGPVELQREVERMIRKAMERLSPL